MLAVHFVSQACAWVEGGQFVLGIIKNAITSRENVCAQWRWFEYIHWYVRVYHYRNIVSG